MTPFWKDPKYRGGLTQGIGVGLVVSLLLSDIDNKWLVAIGLLIILIGFVWTTILSPKK
jgi:hypothetical protein